MKRIFTLSIFMLLFSAAFAQTTESLKPPTPAERAHTQAMRLKKMLTLSDEQVVKVEAVMVEHNIRMDELNTDKRIGEEVQKDIDARKAETDRQLMDIFTPEQFIQYKDIQKKRQERKSEEEK